MYSKKVKKLLFASILLTQIFHIKSQSTILGKGDGTSGAKLN